MGLLRALPESAPVVSPPCSSCLSQHLDNHSPKYPLEGLKTPLGSRTAAQQLQALHTENLHLKACLKEEVQARQRLEKKHGELLDLLRYVHAVHLGGCWVFGQDFLPAKSTCGTQAGHPL